MGAQNGAAGVTGEPRPRKARELVVLLLAAGLAGWGGNAWWSDHQERRHCRSVVEQETNLNLGSRRVRLENYGDVEEPDGLSATDRARYLGNVRREIDRCIANDVPLD